MALEEYLGAVVLEIDGLEVEIADYSVKKKTGRKLVKTMNKTGHAKGFSRGMAEYDINIAAIIPLKGDIDWMAIEGSKLTIYPIVAGEQRISYLDCFTIEVSEKYSVDNEARRDISMGAMREVTE